MFERAKELFVLCWFSQEFSKIKKSAQGFFVNKKPLERNFNYKPATLSTRSSQSKSVRLTLLLAE